MTESNKVVIKINYNEGNNSYKKKPEAKIITEWNLKRIFYALAIITALILIGILFLTGLFDEKTIEPSKADLQIYNKPVLKKEIAINPVSNLNSLKPKITEIKPDSKKLTNIPVKKPVDIIKSPTIYNPKKITTITSDSRITRALLTTKIKDKEPVDTISLPISIKKNEAIEVFYYTEIMDMKGKALYHHWILGNKSIYTKKIKIAGNRWRASTSKLIQASKAGNWTVRLLNEDNIILNEIKFEVIKK